MASILNFPPKFFAESPETPCPTSPSAEEAALRRLRPGPRLVVPSHRPPASSGFGHELSSPSAAANQPYKTVSRIDLALARQSNRSRLRRLFSPSDYTDNWPLGAA